MVATDQFHRTGELCVYHNLLSLPVKWVELHNPGNNAILKGKFDQYGVCYEKTGILKTCHHSALIPERTDPSDRGVWVFMVPYLFSLYQLSASLLAKRSLAAHFALFCVTDPVFPDLWRHKDWISQGNGCVFLPVFCPAVREYYFLYSIVPDGVDIAPPLLHAVGSGSTAGNCRSLDHSLPEGISTAVSSQKTAPDLRRTPHSGYYGKICQQTGQV